MDATSLAFADPVVTSRSAAMRQLGEIVSIAAPASAHVLITGEPGVGKEVLARYMHAHSTRKREPFITLDCNAERESTAAQLFGETASGRGRAGKLREADGGTLFLDEISALDSATQAALVRWLEHGTLPVLRRAAERVDVRVLASTRRDLETLERKGQFRADLLMRLRAVEIKVPPLREHCEDIRPLVSQLIARSGRGVVFSDALLDALERHAWPGNLRELATVVEQIIWRVKSEIAGIDDLPGPFRADDSITLLRASDRRRRLADDLFDGITEGRLSFWNYVYPLFMNRDITRTDVRDLVRTGLSASQGSYRGLLRLFRIEEVDYKRFLNFLASHECTVDSREYRRRPDVKTTAIDR
jgi:DNA-binding NtrC family response regulator